MKYRYLQNSPNLKWKNMHLITFPVCILLQLWIQEHKNDFPELKCNTRWYQLHKQSIDYVNSATEING